jgi:hypothetical protein
MDRMKGAAKARFWRLSRALLLVLLGILLVATAGIYLATRWRQRLPEYVSEAGSHLSFVQVTEPGFDAAGRARLADSAWSMRYYQADGSDAGYLYVGTDNNIVGLALAALKERKQGGGQLPVQPPQVRRYRPDHGPKEWEVVLDLAEREQPPYLDEGFRSMAVYRAQADGRTYLYTGTMAVRTPSVWRTATGEPGEWEKAFTFPDDPASKIGSIRSLVAHDDGLLYMSTTPIDDITSDGIGQIWVTDGTSFEPVIADGFGNPNNVGITTMASYNGCLYAGTYNPTQGYEVWKLRCVADPTAPPQQIISGGAGQHHNEAAMSMRVFKDHLYLGTGIPLGFNPVTHHGPRGCSVLRISPDEGWELVVGPEDDYPLSGYGPGFGWYLNSYCWYMKEYDGQLYLGTWDLSRTIAFLAQDAEHVAPATRPLLDHLVAKPQDWGSPVGGDLYRTADGVHWEPVFLDGLGNPDNHGIRTLEPTPFGFFVGTENPFSRLQVWRLNGP